MIVIKASRYHDISVGHRVAGHEGKCQHLHGHNYRIHFEIEGPKLDAIGRVLDFSVIKERLCVWLEATWDHKFLAWAEDPLMTELVAPITLPPTLTPAERNFSAELWKMIVESMVWVPFNPTAENMAKFLIDEVGPAQLKGTGCTLTSVTIEETRKCSATCRLEV